MRGLHLLALFLSICLISFSCSSPPSTPTPLHMNLDGSSAFKASQYECGSCLFIYDEEIGNTYCGLSPGTWWSQIPTDWACPACGAPKSSFKMLSEISDSAFMWRALELAAKARGHTRPNPIVGCVIVDKEGKIVGEGWHAKAGGDHAEVMVN